QADGMLVPVDDKVPALPAILLSVNRGLAYAADETTIPKEASEDDVVDILTERLPHFFAYIDKIGHTSFKKADGKDITVQPFVICMSVRRHLQVLTASKIDGTLLRKVVQSA